MDGFVEADVSVVEGLRWGEELGLVGLWDAEGRGDLLPFAVGECWPVKRLIVEKEVLAEIVLELEGAPPGEAVAARAIV